ncbi:hypothetical protein LZD49_32150 [Dyadobacter sp. CY261]|uniref:hypothetical protein n=1 Tax=Dyadobacter sp. CY261 TaxID=2907203 RepID=UPI001F24325D|nr:hypothetical protein [Dyadobacter sp. CY261]MCF0075180.1 hypothetical protein [Dyadobacter sp. CY261]
METLTKRLCPGVLSALIILGITSCTRELQEPMVTEAAGEDPYDARLMEKIGTLPSTNYSLEDMI